MKHVSRNEEPRKCSTPKTTLRITSPSPLSIRDVHDSLNPTPLSRSLGFMNLGISLGPGVVNLKLILSHPRFIGIHHRDSWGDPAVERSCARRTLPRCACGVRVIGTPICPRRVFGFRISLFSVPDFGFRLLRPRISARISDFALTAPPDRHATHDRGLEEVEQRMEQCAYTL